jgi:hypothetical protein
MSDLQVRDHGPDGDGLHVEVIAAMVTQHKRFSRRRTWHLIPEPIASGAGRLPHAGQLMNFFFRLGRTSSHPTWTKETQICPDI